MTITYGSVCSGIEAASVAWEPLGMKAAWFSQFDPEHNYSRGPDFPSAVLAHHWPEVSNLGDMTKIADKVLNGEVNAPDILVGGTPCQAFSVAGARAGLSDPRGQLTLSYVDLANAIDKKRASEGKRPTVIVWENVPGVLNSKDNAFGCFLGALSGEDDQLIPPGKKWANAGCVFGPQRTVAWIVKDAQYFGVAQRRRRVFVIASARTDIDPAKILFESDSVRRDTAPSREAGKAVAALTANGVGTCGPDDNQGQAGHLIPISTSTWPVSHCLNAGGMGRIDYETETMVVHGTQDPDTLKDMAHALGRNHGQENAVISFSSKDNGQDAAIEISPTLRAGGHNTSHANAGAPPAVVRITLEGSLTPWETQGSRIQGSDGVSSTLAANPNGGTRIEPILHNMCVRRLTPVECERLQGFHDNHTLIPTEKRKQITAEEYAYLRHHNPLMTAEQAYRLAADGPRYKAIGNSMAVPVMKWIGERLMMQLSEVAVPEKTVGDYGGSTTPVDIRDLWKTPPQIYAHLNAEFGFSVDLAASSANQLHDNYITSDMDTLKIDWCGMYGRSWGWLNPPYSDIGPFVIKAIEQQQKGFGTVMLVPADTSVGWFSLALPSISEVRFITGGRLSFIRADTGKPVNGNNKGSMLLIFSPYKIGALQFGVVDRDVLMAPL